MYFAGTPALATIWALSYDPFPPTVACTLRLPSTRPSTPGALASRNQCIPNSLDRGPLQINARVTSQRQRRKISVCVCEPVLRSRLRLRMWYEVHLAAVLIWHLQSGSRLHALPSPRLHCLLSSLLGLPPARENTAFVACHRQRVIAIRMSVSS